MEDSRKIRTALAMAMAANTAKVALAKVQDFDRPFADREAALKEYTSEFYAMEQAPFTQCPVYVAGGRIRNCTPTCACGGTNWVVKSTLQRLPTNGK